MALVVIAFVPPFQPMCSPKKAYPYVMSWASLLFVINFFFHWSVYCRSDWYLKPIEELHADDIDNMGPTAINSDACDDTKKPLMKE